MWSSLQRLSSSRRVVPKSRYWWKKAANWHWSEEDGFFILNVMVKTHNVLCRFLTFAPDLSLSTPQRRSVYPVSGFLSSTVLQVFLSPSSSLQTSQQKCSFFSFHPWQSKQVFVWAEVQTVHRSSGWPGNRVPAAGIESGPNVELRDPAWRVLAAAAVNRLSVGQSRTRSAARRLVVIVHAEASLDHHVAVEVFVSAVLVWNTKKVNLTCLVSSSK